ncbi:MAG: alpha-L-arabinofuranosidase C-terminal domain-containing protein [Prevotellaceae bacterium]|nr:alpha-L-arabinofuranosidase C-terminal domain-containing protein [Prevotellaceae bacterium]MDO4932225.1 alpha-L-arabinofuranosidase C-terminal domain-containing protein [Prevotellaceae bacterium]
MKRQLTAMAVGIMASTMAMANHPDSIYVRPDVSNGTRNFQIAYSQDRKHWTHVHCNLFESDYGPWGSEKKLYYPVLSYDGRTFRATFIPNPKIPQIATTQSDNFTLWKPQDYPTLPAAEFQKTLERQKAASENNVIRVPYSALQALLTKKKLADMNFEKERENYVATSAAIAKAADGITASIVVNAADRKAISPDLMGIFFEDISYAADGGLYAELVQNRDFEYSAKDHKGWNAQTAWTLEGEGTTWSIETAEPLHANNSHYALLKTTKPGARLVNEGWDGISLKAKAKYLLSMFVKGKGSVRVSLVKDGETLAACVISGTSGWKQKTATLTPSKAADGAKLVIEPLRAGELAVDFVSLFPKDTFKGRANGLRKDLAQVIADLKPRFVRFPGGCASHGQGIDNIYHWQATVGDLWERQSDMNIWNYHQTRGLGFYEYFTFCEDIGAEPLPVLAAGVPCQNSWRGGNGQQGGIPFEKDLAGKPSPYTYNGKPLTMESYLQELLDLIEWANGDPKTSKLAAMRAKAGHAKPFNMKYLGIGNEDLISDVFMERYLFLINGVKKAHPEITVVGTVGPFWEGSDYEYGWQAAKDNRIEIVDEHYYNTPGWYFNHRDYYDNYDRNGTKVYLGEWASKGNNVSNALVEAAYLTNVERNADVVVMSSYAPLLAKEGHTNWQPDLIFFNNTEVKPTANYYVQRAFGQNAGDEYVASSMTVDYSAADGRKPLVADIANRIDKSVVVDSRTGDVIVKIVSMLPKDVKVNVNIGEELMRHNLSGKAELSLLAQPSQPDRTRTWEVNETKQIDVAKEFTVQMPAFSFAVVRIGK